MSSYPDSIYSPRTKQNKSGVVYDPLKTQVIYADDIVNDDNEIVAIENELGLLPKNTSTDVAERIKGFRSLAGATDDLVEIDGNTIYLGDQTLPCYIDIEQFLALGEYPIPLISCHDTTGFNIPLFKNTIGIFGADNNPTMYFINSDLSVLRTISYDPVNDVFNFQAPINEYAPKTLLYPTQADGVVDVLTLEHYSPSAFLSPNSVGDGMRIPFDGYKSHYLIGRDRWRFGSIASVLSDNSYNNASSFLEFFVSHEGVENFSVMKMTGSVIQTALTISANDFDCPYGYKVSGVSGITGDLKDSAGDKIADVAGGIITKTYY